ncbi:MAG: RNA polymerase sigma factor RpoD/SigA [Anaerolineae bacterium]
MARKTRKKKTRSGSDRRLAPARSPSDLVGLYLGEVGHIPLLTPEEEVSLSRLWQNARRAEKQLKGRVDKETRAKLEGDVREGQQARDQLIKANSRLVVSMARRYMGRGVPLVDLIQEGNLGLMKAVDRYDPERGFRFSTYAIWWIRQSVARAVSDQGRTIRLPAHLVENLGKIEKTSRRLTQELGREPTQKELAEEMGIEGDRVSDILQMAGEPVSLEAPVGSEDTSLLGEFIEDLDAARPPAIASESLLGEEMEEALASLSEREARVLRLRFGLEGGHPHTLEQVGEVLGLTRERIRQIQTQALRRLRHPRRSKPLREFLN